VCMRNDETKMPFSIRELEDSILEEDLDLFTERAYEHR